MFDFANAGVARRRKRSGVDPHVTYRATEALNDGRRLVGGCVVHDENVVGPAGLGEDAVQRLGEVVPVIVARDDHCDREIGRRAPRGCRNACIGHVHRLLSTLGLYVPMGVEVNEPVLPTCAITRDCEVDRCLGVSQTDPCVLFDHCHEDPVGAVDDVN